MIIILLLLIIVFYFININLIFDSFPVSGQFDAVAIISVDNLSEIKDITTEIQLISGVERTETMIEV